MGMNVRVYQNQYFKIFVQKFKNHFNVKTHWNVYEFAICVKVFAKF